MTYEEDQMLMLSGIQHFVFCPRQWALIHIEQQWDDNSLTIDGQYLHERVDDPSQRMLNKGVITLRGVHIASKQIGLYGIADAIELERTDDNVNSISHPRYDGLWIPHPIEYKHGHAKTDDCDIAQLVAQVMCLEEMYGIKIPTASLFYWKVRRRNLVSITDNLREMVSFYVREMHRLMNEICIPKCSYEPKCARCSLYNICMPPKVKISSVNTYLNNNLYEKTP